jgi:hypothetical protein
MRRALLGVASAIAIVGGFVSCDDDDRYVYTARRFDEANACLGPFTPIELVVGEGADVKCPPTCLTFKNVLYVSPVCPPLPVDATEVPADDERCQAALDAFRTETSCDADEEEDGGDEEAGSEEEDGSSDAGAVEDAAEEV